jgi:hypothetical protein
MIELPRNRRSIREFADRPVEPKKACRVSCHGYQGPCCRRRFFGADPCRRPAKEEVRGTNQCPAL